MKDLLLKLSKKVGFETEEGKEIEGDALISFISQKLSDNLANEQEYAREIGKLKEDKTSLETQLTEAQDSLKEYNEKKAFISIGETALAKLRERTLSVYQTLKGDEKDETILKLIENSDFQVTESLLKQYEAELEKLSPLACSKCGNTEISRASSAREDGEGDSGNQGPTYKPNHEVIENRKKARFSTSRIHQ